MTSSKPTTRSVVRQRTSALDRILDQRAAKLLETVNPQVGRTLNELTRSGVDVEIVGSMARGDFKNHSDVDFLVSDKGEFSETDVFNIISDHMHGAPFDVIFAETLRQTTVALMRCDAQSR